MSRSSVLWGAALAAVVGGGPSFAETPAEDVLAEKGLRRAGALYVLKSEDEVKTAAEAAEARLKAYRLAEALEKDAARGSADRKTLLAALTRERLAMKQQYDRAMPEIRAQVQALTRQQSELRQQLGPMRDAARYNNNRFAYEQYRQLANAINALADQITPLELQRSRLMAARDEIDTRIDFLNRGSDSPEVSPKPSVPADERRKAYTEALAEQRKLVDETRARYAALAADAEVKAALGSVNRGAGKIKYTLGPSRKFLDAVKALEQAEARLAGGDVTAPPSTGRRTKAKAARRK